MLEWEKVQEKPELGQKAITEVLTSVTGAVAVMTQVADALADAARKVLDNSKKSLLGLAGGNKAGKYWTEVLPVKAKWKDLKAKF
eukprot:6464502-Amphidinium_carterae.1